MRGSSVKIGNDVLGDVENALAGEMEVALGQVVEARRFEKLFARNIPEGSKLSEIATQSV